MIVRLFEDFIEDYDYIVFDNKNKKELYKTNTKNDFLEFIILNIDLNNIKDIYDGDVIDGYEFHLKNPITMRFDYNGDDSIFNTLYEFLSSNQKKTKEELFRILRLLGKLNNSAYKGYGRLSDDHFDYNAVVYDIKDNILIKIITIFLKNNWNVTTDKVESCFYFRDDDGIQLSFHYYGDFIIKHNKLFDLIRKLCDEKRFDTWDGVNFAYLYTKKDIDKYNSIKNNYKRKIEEIKTKNHKTFELAKDTIKNYFNKRRKMVKMDYKTFCKKIDDIDYDIIDENMTIDLKDCVYHILSFYFEKDLTNRCDDITPKIMYFYSKSKK